MADYQLHFVLEKNKTNGLVSLQYIPHDEHRVRGAGASGVALFAYELPSPPVPGITNEVRAATRSARDRSAFSSIQRSTHHSSPCLRGTVGLNILFLPLSPSISFLSLFLTSLF